MDPTALASLFTAACTATDDDPATPAADPGLCPACRRTPAAAIARRTVHEYRRAFSESKLLDLLPARLDPAHTYHVLTGGDIDALSFLKHIIRAQPLDYCLLSTWCMADDDILQLAEWLDSRRITRLDAYVGEIFPGSYTAQHAGLKRLVDRCGGRVAVFRNHSKTFAGIGPDYPFAIASSANINTNPRTENTVIAIGRDVFDFYKSYYDGIKSYLRDYDTWQPWPTPAPAAAPLPAPALAALPPATAIALALAGVPYPHASATAGTAGPPA
jgi:hypothetical protein